MFNITEEQRAFLKSRGMTDTEIKEYVAIHNTPLSELLERYDNPLEFDIDLDEFFREMKILGWKREDAEDRVKSCLPDVDDADEIILIKQFLFPAQKDEVY